VTGLEVAGTVLIATGGVFMLATAIGVVNFPDFYTRLHAAGKGDTLGQGLVLLGLLLVAGDWGVALKLALIVFFLFIFNPTATHALARAAWVSGLKPWRKGDPTEGGA
jgi:multicomponent Na+:H+ antiporter subunit G